MCKANKSHAQVLDKGFPGSSVVKNMGSVVVSPMQETQVRSLVREDPTCCGAKLSQSTATIEPVP